jgi:hypothetical protein
VPGAVDERTGAGGLAERVAGPVLVEHRRVRREAEQRERLRAGLPDDVALAGLALRPSEVTRADLAGLADELEGAAA